MIEFTHHIVDEAALDDLMSLPSSELIAFVDQVCSPLVIVGAGGKMGPSLAIRAKRAASAAGHRLDVIAVSRFSSHAARQFLESHQVETLQCDVMDREAVARLPDSENVLYLVGLKFGTKANPAPTWATNTLAPALVAERYRGARIVALSTGNVYPFVGLNTPGAAEDHPLTPIGEYANSCVARERIFEYFAQIHRTPIAIIRLSYALDLRYGVLVDIAQRVWTNEPIDLTMGYANVIWQGDANDMIIRALQLAGVPAIPINLTGSERISIRQVAEQFGKLMGRQTHFTGHEADTALLSDVTRMLTHFGPPPTPLSRIVEWTADWIMRGGTLLHKPTHFQTRDGEF